MTAPRKESQPVEEVLNSFAIVQQQCDTCALQLELPKDIAEIIKNPMREIQVSIPVRMDDGSIKFLKVSGCSTMMPLDRPRAGFVSTLMKQLTLSVLWPPG